jgi:NAD(P)-dependent dehydrogenase (short-subunit alcohol dehydrogenase family)
VGDLLAGVRAVITGGGGGIGRAISERFAAEGARVVVAEKDEARGADTVAAIGATGGDATFVPIDVTDRDAVAELASTAGEVDVLVNNVGHHLHPRHDFVRSSEQEWDELHEINLLHVFRCCRAIAPGMVERGRGGSIINVSTVEAHRGIPQHAVYSAYKAGVSAFTRSLALELGQHHIRVNAIAPDLTETLAIRYSEWVPEEQQPLIPTWVPVGRFGAPSDIAGVALFLASELSAFVTGTTVHADGGSLAAGGWYRRLDGTWTNRPLQP